MNYAALIFWVLIAWSVIAKPGVGLILLIASIPFDGLALIPTDITGGLSILPKSMFAVVLIAKVLGPEVVALSPKLMVALQLRHLGVLAVFLLVGIVATVFMPRLFLGEIVVIPMRLSTSADLLMPTSANFTQSAYVTLSVMTVFTVTLIADGVGFTEKFLLAILAGGTVCVLTGLIDVAAASAGVESWLEPFRNAGYSFLIEAQPEGAAVRRVIGLTPEASAYGAICVQFAAGLVMLRNLYKGRQRMLATIIAMGLVVMALLSTSSAAYGGLAILGVVYAGNFIRRAAFTSSFGQGGLLGELFVGVGLLIVLVIILIVRADLFDPLLVVLNAVIFNKSLTSSFYERSLWNTIAWEATGSSWGLGIGFGSTRTSNWFAAIVSNSGLIGAALMCIFLVKSFAKRVIGPNPVEAELLTGLKLSLPPALAMLCVAAAGPDFGLWFGIILGAITGITAFRPGRSAVGAVAVDRSMTPRMSRQSAFRRRPFGPNAPQTAPPNPRPR